MINLRSGADNHESGYKTSTSTTSQMLVLCLELDLDQVIYAASCETDIIVLLLSNYYSYFTEEETTIRFRGVVSNIHSPSELHDKVEKMFNQGIHAQIFLLSQSFLMDL